MLLTRCLSATLKAKHLWGQVKITLEQMEKAIQPQRSEASTRLRQLRLQVPAQSMLDSSMRWRQMRIAYNPQSSKQLPYPCSKPQPAQPRSTEFTNQN